MEGLAPGGSDSCGDTEEECPAQSGSGPEKSLRGRSSDASRVRARIVMS